jgi:hypothetical protein
VRAPIRRKLFLYEEMCKAIIRLLKFQVSKFTQKYAMENGNLIVSHCAFSCVIAPSAPRDFVVLWFNSTSVNLQWFVPLERNGDISEYLLQYEKKTSSGSGQFCLIFKYFLACCKFSKKA